MKFIIREYHILLLILLVSCASAQNNNYASYYYKGDLTPVFINPYYYNIYFNDTNSEFASQIIKENVVDGMTYIKDKIDGCQIAYQIYIYNNNYDSVLQVLKESPSITDVEPVIGDDYRNSVSNLLYFKLEDDDNIQRVLCVMDSLGVKYHGKITGLDGWHLASVDKFSQGNSIVVSNILWETGLLNEIDPGFIFNFKSNSVCVSDSSIGEQWGLEAINACDAWDITTGNTNVRLAVLDQGVDISHKELVATNVVYSFDLENQTTPAYSWWDPDRNGEPQYYHGTHVGGIIFSKHNDYCIAGVCPNVGLLNISHSLQIRDNNDVYKFSQGLLLAVQNGARIINNSWGDRGGFFNQLHSTLIESAIDNAINNDVVVIFASGNDSINMDYPATYRAEILTVGAVSSSLRKTFFSGYGQNLDVVAPGSSIISTQNGNKYASWDGTSMAAPHVSGVAALMFSINPNLTSQQVRDIIEITAQKVGEYNYLNYYNRPNGTWNDSVGYGMVDANSAVQKALDYKNDLFIRDTITDDGSVPSNMTRTWESPDIWVEDINGMFVGNPAGYTTYNVCVRIHNRNDITSSGTEKLYLNWAKAGINDNWYDNWTNDYPLDCEVPKGGAIGDQNGILIPPIPANSSIIVRVPWFTPSAERYENCTGFNENIWHFCLLARLHDDDIIAHENERFAGVYNLVRNHNNVAQRNVTLSKSAAYSTVFSINNPTNNLKRYFLGLLKRQNDASEIITDFAEISLSLDDGLLNSIDYDNLIGAKFVNDNTLLITDNDFVIPLQLEAGQFSTILTSVNFFTNKNPNNDTTYFDIVAYTDEALSESAGGLSYHNIYTHGRNFSTNAGNDTAILINTSATLHGTQINEDAVYRWYDKQRNFKYEGLNFTVTPSETSEYILEITAESDGYRDLDTVKVNVVPGCIRAITPNPVEGNYVSVSYEYATTVNSAYLYIYNTGTTTLVGSYDLTNLGNLSSLDVEVTNYPTGSYTVVLVCDNAVSHSKIFIRQ